MPSIEKHVKFCVKEFGKENEELCYMVNSWMDAPSRELGGRHRILRHDLFLTWQMLLIEHGYWKVKLSPEDVERARDGSINIDNYGLKKYFPKIQLILEMIVQHLRLDGLLTPRQIEELVNNPPRVKVIFRGDTGEAVLDILGVSEQIEREERRKFSFWR